MAVAYQVEVRNRFYTVVDDLTIVYRALIAGMVRDEVTGEPPRTKYAVRVGRGDLHAKTLDGGLFCIAGYPEQVFPDLSTTGYLVELVITAPGYRGASLLVNIPPNTTFPVDAGDVSLRRPPVRVQGRVVDNTTDRNPIADAKILIVDDPSPPAPLTEHVVALRTPLHFEHAGGVTVRLRQLTPAGPPKQLGADALAGSRTLTLKDRIGVAVNDVLRIGPEIRVEYAVIESLAPQPADPTQPGNVTLRSALNRSFPVNTEVQKVTPGAIGTVRTLVQEADAGDGVLILDDVLNVDTIEVVDPTPEQVEYHALGALTDAEGFYRLDGVGRVRTVHLDASATGFTTLPKPIPWTINYEQPVNVVSFRLSP
ncbi:MAG: hypothetical protein ACE5LU_19075 [Anaerolineae bacterium]